jgi:hypothetical protein
LLKTCILYTKYLQNISVSVLQNKFPSKNNWYTWIVINLWRKVVCLFVLIDACWHLLDDIACAMFLFPLESCQWVRVPQLGFIMLTMIIIVIICYNLKVNFFHFGFWKIAVCLENKCITKLSTKLVKLKIKILSYNEIEDDNENKAM